MCCAKSVSRSDLPLDERPALVELFDHGSVPEMGEIMDSNRLGIGRKHLSTVVPNQHRIRRLQQPLEPR